MLELSSFYYVPIPTFPNMVVLFAVSLIALYVYLWHLREHWLRIRNLNGPDPDHWFWGNLKFMANVDPMTGYNAWTTKYGPTLRYSVFANSPRLFTIDPIALSHIVNDNDTWPCPPHITAEFEAVTGQGLLVVHGEAHKRQKRIMAPGFGPGAIKNLLPVFHDKAEALKDKLDGLIQDGTIRTAGGGGGEKEKSANGRKINVLKYVTEATLDVIGKAAFDYDFGCLSGGKQTPMAKAFEDMSAATTEMSASSILQRLLPGGSKLPTARNKTFWKSRAIIDQVAEEILQQKKLAVQVDVNGEVTGKSTEKDLLSLIVQANMAADMEPHQRMSDEEVKAEITTFMLAGSDTAATAITWSLYVLTLHPDIQKRLREELLAVPETRPDFETLSSLPYLEAFVREILRLYTPVPQIFRHSVKDCIVPLQNAVVGRDGTMIEELFCQKGTAVLIPIASIGASPYIYGPDAAKFQPERWLNITPELATSIHKVPGPWGGLLTFGGGFKHCIGYRFALAEIKAILFVLLRNFQFDQWDEEMVVLRKTAMFLKPKIKGREEEGLQMPLIVKSLSS